MSKLTVANKLVSIVDDEGDFTEIFGNGLGNLPSLYVFTFTDPVTALEHFKQALVCSSDF